MNNKFFMILFTTTGHRFLLMILKGKRGKQNDSRSEKYRSSVSFATH